MPDEPCTVESLKQTVAAFANDRDWEQFHSLKNLSMSISIEAAELMECFQWVEGPDSNAVSQAGPGRIPIEEELADVVIYALQFANQSGIDLSDAIRRKVAINASKYPIEKSKGKSDRSDAR